MANESSEMIRLQMAMAFGQGAGCMLAAPDALTFLLSSQHDLIERAVDDWTASRFAFTELVRVLGQVTATLAAVDRSPQIEKRHVEAAIQEALKACPCFGKFPSRE